MELWAILRQKFAALRKRRQLDQDLDDELAFHIAMHLEKLRDGGMSAAEAAAAARRAFGNPVLLREKARTTWTFQWLEHLGQDLRYALRSMRKSPVLASVVVLSLALGIGPNTAIFSLIDAVMLRMLPVQNPQELVAIAMREPGRPRPNDTFTNPLWEALRDEQNVFSSVFAFENVSQLNMAQGGMAQNISGIFVSGDFFTGLGVTPAEGRLITSADDHRGCAGVVVLGNGFWQRHFGGAESALGSTLVLNNQAFRIVGVSPARFHGVEVGRDFDVALPLCSAALFDRRNIEGRSRWWLKVMGRVKPGMAPEQLNAQLASIAPSVTRAALPEDWTGADRQRFLGIRFFSEPASVGASQLRESFGEPLEVLMAIVGLVLLIACANIASLVLAKASTRTKEVAVRKALGASRSRIVRQFLTETVLLSLVGAALGLLFARWGSALMVRNLSTGREQLFLDLAIDWRVLLFTAGVAVLTGVLMGVLPALRSTHVALVDSMKADASTGQKRRAKAGQWIVAGQVALSLVLLASGSLLLRSFVKLLDQDLGFDRSNVLIVLAKAPWFASDTIRLAPQQRTATYEEILRRLRALPGVSSAALSFTTPFGDDNWVQEFHAERRNAPTGEAAAFYLNFISPGYFATLRMPLLAGRDFDEHDSTAAPKVAVINQTLARKFFAGVQPVGKRFRWGEEKDEFTVVGVVKDANYEMLKEPPPPTAFFAEAQAPPRANIQEFALKSTLPAATLIPAVQRAIANVQPELPLEFHTLAQQVDDKMVQERLVAMLAGLFAVLALGLAMIGLYGVLSYSVTQRQKEFGVRVALGAKPASILRLVMRDVALVLSVGLAAGLAISLVSTRVLQGLLFGLQARDPLTFALSVALLSATALLAAWLPARRATKVDPMVVLRYE